MGTTVAIMFFRMDPNFPLHNSLPLATKRLAPRASRRARKSGLATAELLRGDVKHACRCRECLTSFPRFLVRACLHIIMKWRGVGLPRIAGGMFCIRPSTCLLLRVQERVHISDLRSSQGGSHGV